MELAPALHRVNDQAVSTVETQNCEFEEPAVAVPSQNQLLGGHVVVGLAS